MHTLKILGGGLSGLTAAINLKHAGLDVEIHERKEYCGKPTRDFQFLENWIFEADALDILKGVNIQTDFYLKPWYSLEFISPSSKRCLKKSSQTLMYLVKRGPTEGAVDHALQKQATDANIPIILNSRLTADEADIIATGRKSPNFIITGITFPFDHPDTAITLFDDRLSLKMYSYLIVNDKIGEIVSVNPPERSDHRTRFDLTVKRFEEILDFKIGTVSHRFAAPGSLFFLKRASINGRHFIGEAAGFQDCLAGFGMMYAFKSGYHAACSLIHNDDFDRRWQADMLRPMQVSRSNRLLFERLSNDGYERLVHLLCSTNPLVSKLLGGNDLQPILNRLYNRSFSHFLRPVVIWKKLAPVYELLLAFLGRLFLR